MGEEWTITISSTAANSESMGPLDEPKKIVVKPDANGNIKMSNSEIKEILLPLFPVSAEEVVDRVVTEMDGDGDGVIRFEQFIGFLQKEEIRFAIKCCSWGAEMTLLPTRKMPIHPGLFPGPLAPGVTVPGTHEVNNLPPPCNPSLVFSSFLNKSTAIGGGKYMEEKLEKSFACFDTDGDGKISAIEVKSVLSSLGRVISLEEAQSIMTKINKDGDGLVDLEDLTGFLCKEVRIDVEGSFAFDPIPQAYRLTDDYAKWMKEPEMAIAYPTEPDYIRGGTWWEAAAKVLAKFAAVGCAAAVLTLLASDLPRDYAWIAIGVALVIPLCAVSLA